MPVIELASLSPRANANGRLRALAVVTLFVATGTSAWLCRAPPPSAAPVLDIVDVGAEMTKHGTLGPSAGLGGVALQLPINNRARMFRADPSDRRELYGVGGAVDYFLEDPHGLRTCGGLTVDLSAMVAGADVFVIDGNLWLDSHRYRLFELDAGPIPVTIVVRGDVHIGDDVLMRVGALTLVALEREDGTGGNIIIDDATFGTPPQVVQLTLASTHGVTVASPSTPHGMHVKSIESVWPTGLKLDEP